MKVESMNRQDARSFYDEQYLSDAYANRANPQGTLFFKELENFIREHNLFGKKVLEVGCGRGVFQDLVESYIGVDISFTVYRWLHKPYVVCFAEELPFPDNEFDAIWTITVLEHLHEPEFALKEFRRVLRPAGVLFLAPAWYCRPWNAHGYPVRPYSDLDFKGRLIKATIPIRDSLLVRALCLLPKRVIGRLELFLKRSPLPFRFTRLQPNYEQYWMSDSDASASMDPYAAILWFVSRGDECLSCPGEWRALAFRTGPVVFRIRKC